MTPPTAMERIVTTNDTNRPLLKRAKLKCCHEPTRCTNGVYWLVARRGVSLRDAQPYCRKHFEMFCDRPETNVHDYKIVRLGGLEWG